MQIGETPRALVFSYFRSRAAGEAATARALALLVNACAGGAAVLAGEVHGQVLKSGFNAHIVVKNSLLKMYGCLGCVASARKVFDESPELDTVSYNTMVTAYGRRGDVAAAREMFDATPARSLVSWSAMLDGYVKSGEFSNALRLFGVMQSDGFRPDAAVLVSVLKACAHAGALDQGRRVHRYVRRRRIGRNGNVVLETALVDMYSKCGCIEEALQVFRGAGSRDVVLWNAMIGGLAMHGHSEQALELFDAMRREGFAPNDSTFIAALCACTHAGNVERGREMFGVMKADCGIEPRREHYGCLADLLARAGRVEEAEKLLLDMPMEPHAAQWGVLMSSCRMHRKFAVGERVGRRLIQLEPDDGGRYILLANMYTACGRWDDAKAVRQEMEDRGARKETGRSLIECDGVMHEFISGDRSHPQSSAIYAQLAETERRLAAAGYVKDTSQVAVDVDDEEEKGNALSHHSERLALAFGLLAVPPGLPIRIVKNLRVCGDCHAHAKLVSALYGRVIVVRDRHRFHKFAHGACSCNDYW